MDGSGVLLGVEELTQALIATATAATQASTTAAGDRRVECGPFDP